MTVRIPIVTIFDSKGLRQAQHQLNKVRGNFQNLGRNAAIAGAAVGAFGAAIAISAKALARIETINAQTNAVLKSTGTVANGTAKDIENLAGRLEALTATEAETIQEGANLLLTFKNIRNEAGAGNDIFNQTTAAMVDVARAMGTSASGEAIRLGKALNDPIRGISALTRVGITFTEEQKEQIKTLSESGDIMAAQKIILAELQSQFGGSGAAFAQTFTGQMELLNHELGAVGEEATMAVMPALQQMVEGFREIIPIIGPQLKAAIESVDWQAFAKSVVDLTTFLITNAETIAKVVTALFLLNTAYNLGRVGIGLYNAAAVILGNTFTVTAGKIGLSTGAVKLFSRALRLIPYLAVIAGLIALGDALVKNKAEFELYKKQIGLTNDTLDANGNKLSDLQLFLKPLGDLMAELTFGVINFDRALRGLPSLVNTTVRVNYEETGFRDSRQPGYTFSAPTPPEIPAVPTPIPTSRAGSVTSDPTGLRAWTANNAKEAKISAKEITLISKGLSADVARSLVGGNTPIKTALAAIDRINKNGTKAIANLTKSYQKSAAGQQAAAAQASAAAEQASNAAAAAAQAAAEQAAREAAILAEKQRVYESFAYSVTSTFGRIRDSIMGAFSLPELGGSTDSIIRNMDKLLARVKSFSANITKLSNMGLDPKLLQQVINAGPIAGAKLASNLVAGGAGALATINRGFADIGNLASEIGTTGTQATFGTQAQQQIYNVTINGGLDSGPSIGKAVVDAIKAYERTSGVVFQGA
jgi:hypothetical protein